MSLTSTSKDLIWFFKHKSYVIFYLFVPFEFNEWVSDNPDSLLHSLIVS